MIRRLLRQLTVGRVVLLLPLVAVVIGARSPVRDNSFLWHIQAGQLQLDRGSVLTSDPFSFTAAGEPWRTQSWLADLVYGYVEQLSPLAVGSWVTAISAAVLLIFVALRAYRSVPSTLVTGIVGLWVMWLALGWFSPRPVVISLALFSLFLAGQSFKVRWATPLIMWIWASVHGGFVVGLGYLVLRVLVVKKRSYLREVASSMVAVSLTAHGWGTWEVLINFLAGREALDTITEWATPDLFGLALMPFLGVITALIVVGMRGQIERSSLWVIIPFLLFAFTASRSVPLATLVLVPWMALFLSPLSKFQSLAPGNAVTFAVAFLALALPWLLPLDSGLDRSRFPVDAAQHLTEAHVFHDDGTGGYLIYSQYPDRFVYIDDRAELYKEKFVEFGQARSGMPVWREVFSRWGVRQVLLKRDTPLLEVLRAGGWREHFSDEEFVILNEE